MGKGKPEYTIKSSKSEKAWRKTTGILRDVPETDLKGQTLPEPEVVPRESRSARITPVSISRGPTYIDDVTLDAMITSGMMESLGPVNFAQFRVPLRPANAYPGQHDSFGGQIDYNLNWMARNITLGDPPQGKGSLVSRLKKFQQSTKDLQLVEDEDEPPKKDPRFLLQQLTMAEARNPQVAEEKTESLMQWFDRSVENELKKRKETCCGGATSFADVMPPAPKDLNVSKGVMEKMAEASASRIEIASQMQMTPDTELTEAVDKLAKAEAMCAFAGAVKAAEAAAE
ncbi:hypothetical protein NQ317_015274, partial [Molorchus minor]